MQELLPIRGLARTTDPTSSHVAGERVARSRVAKSQNAVIIAAIAAHPARTARELEPFTDLRAEQIGKRLSGLASTGRVIRKDRGASPAIFFPAEVAR